MSEKRWFRKYPKLALTTIVITGVLLSILLLESTLFLFLKIPVLNNYFPFFKPVISEVYFYHYRNIMQLMPECAQYDPELSYSLKPGECTLRNIEYTNKYMINRAGFRDDENSLVQPEIILLGDSYTMGWGVEQHESFAYLIEEGAKRKAINAGVPSYGTAREMMQLRRLDTSKIKFIIIQYSANDFVENFTYVNDGFNLRILNEEQYREECERHISRENYAPFLLTTTFLNHFVHFFIKSATARPQSETEVPPVHIINNGSNLLNNVTMEVKMFLEILSAQHFPEEVKVIVLNLSHYSLSIELFSEQLSIWKKKDDYPDFVKNMKILDPSSFLKRDDYYIIDDHLNASGHRKVAEALIKVINEN